MKEAKRREIEQESERRMRPFPDEVTRLCTIAGVDHRVERLGHRVVLGPLAQTA